MQEPLSAKTAKIEIAQPRLFTVWAVLVVSAYGVFLAVPILVSMMVVSLLKFSILTVLIPFVAIAATALFLPLGLGNPYVARLVRSLTRAAEQTEAEFIVQLTLCPRIRSGFRAVLEDADDIGCLSFTGSELLFHGDAVKLSVPLDCIKEVRPQNIGLRGLFVYGRRIGIVVSGLPNVTALEFAERSSWLLPSSRRITRLIQEHLSKK